MQETELAAAVLECVGGKKNVRDNSLCATRLRIRVYDPQLVNHNALNSIRGVLGIATRGDDGIEVVFGPNLVKRVYEPFIWLTGVPGQIGNDEPSASHKVRHASKMHVQITPEVPGKPVTTFDSSDQTTGEDSLEEDDTTDLLDLLLDKDSDLPLSDVVDDASSDIDLDDAAEEPSLLVINGPNINMYGTRASSRKSKDTFSDLLALCHTSAIELGFASCDCFQSNHEGELVDRIQDALYQHVTGIVINASAYAHSSLAILDALHIAEIPAIEVHLNLYDEEDPFRYVSYIGKACIETITGSDISCYRKAIEHLADYLEL